jgi:hypothetical protein
LTEETALATVALAMIWTSQRKSQRFHIAVPVRVSGEDRSGGRFEVEAWTVDVSAEGACIHLPENVWLPRRLRITATDYQVQADANVDVVWERTDPQRAIGVCVLPGTRASAWQAR